MAELLLDQAAGLRRLLNQSRLRTIAVASAAPGAGRTTAAVNLAVALAKERYDVLVLDAANGRASAAWLLNAQPIADLQEWWHGHAALERVIAEGCSGVRVVCATRAFAALRYAATRHANDLAQLFHRVRTGAGVVLIDATAGDLGLVSAARETLLIVGPHMSAITDTYRFLKRLHACAPRHVHVLVNRVVNKTHGDRIFGNLSFTSRRFLHLPLTLTGQVPDDVRLSQAASLRQPVVEAFADADSAVALRNGAAMLLRSAPPEDSFVDFAHRLLQSARIPGTAN